MIPADLIDEAMDVVVETQRNSDSVDPDAAKRKMLDAFAGIGVSAADIAVYLSHPADVLTPKELADLRGIFQAIKDGELSKMATDFVDDPKWVFEPGERRNET